MRQILNFNAGWVFSKTAELPAALPTDWESVQLPHSWNAVDGQDGGNDYFRGTAQYAKTIVKADLPAADRYYLELQAPTPPPMCIWTARSWLIPTAATPPGAST